MASREWRANVPKKPVPRPPVSRNSKAELKRLQEEIHKLSLRGAEEDSIQQSSSALPSPRSAEVESRPDDWMDDADKENEKRKEKESVAASPLPIPEEKSREPIVGTTSREKEEEKRSKPAKPLPERPTSPRGRKPESRPPKPLPQSPRNRTKSPSSKPLPMAPRSRAPEPTLPQTPLSKVDSSRMMESKGKVPQRGSDRKLSVTYNMEPVAPMSPLRIETPDWDMYAGNAVHYGSSGSEHSDDIGEDRHFEAPKQDIDRFYERLLEGYRCWLQKTGQHGRGKNLSDTEKLREILLWRVLMSVAEATSFCPEHIAHCFHAIVTCSARMDGTKEAPYHIDLNFIQRGIAELAQGKVNLDDINYHAMNTKGSPLQSRRGSSDRSVYTTLFDTTPVYFTYEGEEQLGWYIQQHVDAQAKNVEKLLGKYVSVTHMHVPHEKGGFYESASKKGAPPVKPGASKVEPQPKWFHEPERFGVILLILRNYWSILIFKVWAFMFAVQVNDTVDGEKYFKRFAFADALMIIFGAIIAVAARLMVYRWRVLRGMPFGGFMNTVILAAKFVGVLLALVVASGFGTSFFSMSISIPSMVGDRIPWFLTDGALVLDINSLYIIARIGSFIFYNLYLWLCFSPIIKGTPHDTSFSAIFKKKMRWRVVGTFVFWCAVFFITAVFEIYVLVPAVKNVTPDTLCDCKGLIECTYQSSLNCWIVIIFIWALVWANFLIDTHVAFVLLLSIIGLVVGLSSRLRPSKLEQLHIDPHQLINGIKSKWLGPKEDVRRAMKIWNTIVDEMWESDLISEAHQKQLKLQDVIPDEEWIVELPVLEAQERLAFFYNSLSMKAPAAPPLDEIPAVSTLIPSYDETIIFSYEELRRPHYYGGKPGPTDLGYLISSYPAEWEHFTSRLKTRGFLPWNWTSLELYNSFIEKRLPAEGPVVERIRLWASYRAQTIARTIRGVAYYRKVLRELGADEKAIRKKYQVVLALQTYACYDAAKVNAVNLLAREFPFIEIVYDFDREACCKPHLRPHMEKMAFLQAHGIDYAICREEWNAREQQLELTGVLPRMWPLLVGPEGKRVQGKALNQRCGLMYCWGEFLQTLDANQDFTFEDALKVPSLLMAFYQKSGNGTPLKNKVPRYRIIGFREKIYTGNLSLVGKFMALADFSFTTIFGRILANPLSVRMHYGHPDFFDGMWVFGRSGLNKASPVINLNEDIFAGYAATLRCQRITHKEFLQASKGRETSLRLADQFEAKLAEGAAAQMRSSDIFELNQRLNFFKKISLFHGSIGFYLVMTVMAYSISLYVLTLLLFSLAGIGLQELGQLGSVYSTELAVALGFIYMLPGVIELLIAFGVKKFVSILLNFIPSALFFGFLLQTKAANLVKSIMTGNATYRATGRKLTIERYTLKSNFITFAETHFMPGLRLIGLITLYHFVALYNLRYVGVLPLFTPTIVAFTWILVPTLFNPFASFEAATSDARDMWAWLTKGKDLDLCALSYSYPKGEKRLGVPPRRDVEDDSWNNWYILREAVWLRQSFSSKGNMVLYVLLTVLFVVVFAAFVVSVAPSSLICAIYLMLLGMIIIFLLGVKRIVKYLGRDRPAVSMIHIVIDIVALVIIVVFLAVNPIPITAAFSFVDYLVAIVILYFLLRLMRDVIFLVLCPSLRHKPKMLVSTVYYLEHLTLQAQSYWLGAFVVVTLQLLLGYALSLFPKLHSTLLYNPYLTTRTHGLDSVTKGCIRKIEKDVPPPAAPPAARQAANK